MGTPAQTPNSDSFTPEDAAALVHAQQQLYAQGDPRASKLYNYIISQGIASKDDKGNLQLPGQSTENGFQRGVDALTGAEPFNQRPGVVGHAATALGNVGGGLLSFPLALIAHPEQSGKAFLNTMATGLNTPAPFPETDSIPEAMLRGAIQNPTGTAENALGGFALAAGMGEYGPAASQAAREGASALMNRAGNAVDAAKATGAKFLPSLIDGPPESLVTRAVKPGKNNVTWNQDVQTAIPLVKSAESQLGHPIQGMDDTLDAIGLAKQGIWKQYQARLGPWAQRGATIDGNQIADAMMKSVDARTATQNPGLVKQVQGVADTYRRPLTLDQAEDFLQSANRDLNTYYAKNKVGRQVAQNDPAMAATVAEGDALRSALYGKLDDLTGPGAAQLKQSYGALSNLQKELEGRKLVADRQQPESQSEQLSTVRGAGKIAKGFATASPGDVIEGAQNIAVSRAIKARNAADAMLTRAFAAAKPAVPFPMPKVNLPPAGLLPAQSGAPTILPYNPQMDAPGAYGVPGAGGERLAALMQALRQSQPLALPAKASPLIPPPPGS